MIAEVASWESNLRKEDAKFILEDGNAEGVFHLHPHNEKPVRMQDEDVYEMVYDWSHIDEVRDWAHYSHIKLGARSEDEVVYPRGFLTMTWRVTREMTTEWYGAATGDWFSVEVREQIEEVSHGYIDIGQWALQVAHANQQVLPPPGHTAYGPETLGVLLPSIIQMKVLECICMARESVMGNHCRI